MKRIYIEIDGIFYKSCRYAGRVIGCSPATIKNRYLSDNFPNYRLINLKPTERMCATCGGIKPLKEFGKVSIIKDGFRTECKECRSKYCKKWHEDNNEHVKKYKRLPEVRNKENKYKKEKRETDISYKINETMRTNIGRSLRGMKAGRHWERLVGYTLEKLITHLESKFTGGMNWNNYGHDKDKWNLDHIRPISSFNITSYDCQDFKDCWQLDNLQALWAVRNYEKNDNPMHPKYLIKPNNIK